MQAPPDRLRRSRQYAGGTKEEGPWHLVAPFCGSINGPFTKVEGLFTVLICRLPDRGHGSGPYPAMTRAEMHVGLAANDRTWTASPDREGPPGKLAARLLGSA